MLKLDKKIYKIVTIAMMVVMIMSVISNILPAFAAAQAPDPSGLSSRPNTSFNPLLETVLGVVQAVGSFAAVIVLVVVGIRYMTGSVEEKAEYKKTLIPYVVGALLVFAASNIAKIIFDISKNVK